MRKGVSPVISYVLIVAIVVTTASAAYLWAYPHMKKLGEGAKGESLVNQIESLDYAVRQVSHGEVGFRNTFQLYVPEGGIRVNEEHNHIAFSFRQGVGVVPNVNPPEGKKIDSTCTENSTYINDSVTGLILKRDPSNPYVYKGATSSPGNAEVLLCYPNVNLTWRGQCIRGASGPRISVLMEKMNITEDGKRKVSIDFC